MKIKRMKHVHKCLTFYKSNFGFKSPFKVLLDGTFAQHAFVNQVHIREQIPVYLESEVQLITTWCAIEETRKLGPSMGGATFILKQFNIHKCGHEKNPIPANECLKSMIEGKNPNKYIVATQDRLLRKKARVVPGTPVMYFFLKSPVLEGPSSQCERTVLSRVKALVKPGEYHSKVLKDMKEKLIGKPKRPRHRGRKSKRKTDNAIPARTQPKEPSISKNNTKRNVKATKVKLKSAKS